MTTFEPPALTPRGRVTRDRIVDTAAELARVGGAQGATNPAVRAAARISGSQLTHYFPDKESLVRAVVELRADQAVGSTRATTSGRLDSLTALREWADSFVRRDRVWEGGCRFGSLAGEVLKTQPELRADVADGFARWRTEIRDGLMAMQQRGDLRHDADPQRLAVTLLAAYQGGMLLAQAEGDVAPLRIALDEAIAHVAAFVEPVHDLT